LTRLAGSVSSGTVPWIAAAVLVAMAGLVAAALLYRARQPVPAMLACALTGLLISPLSWDHHWVWVAPGIALLAHLGASAGRRARTALCRGAAPGPRTPQGTRKAQPVTEGTSLAGRRERLVAEVLQTSGIRDERIAAALSDVPRHLFLPHLPPEDAYLDDAI